MIIDLSNRGRSTIIAKGKHQRSKLVNPIGYYAGQTTFIRGGRFKTPSEHSPIIICNLNNYNSKRKRSKLVCSSHHQNETYLVKSQQTEQNNGQDILTPNEQDNGMFQECPAAKIKTKNKRRGRRRKTKNNPNRLSDSVGQRNCEERQQSRGRCLKGLGKSFPSDLAAGIYWNSL